MYSVIRKEKSVTATEPAIVNINTDSVLCAVHGVIQQPLVVLVFKYELDEHEWEQSICGKTEHLGRYGVHED
jgi:hypothetical protein